MSRRNVTETGGPGAPNLLESTARKVRGRLAGVELHLADGRPAPMLVTEKLCEAVRELVEGVEDRSFGRKRERELRESRDSHRRRSIRSGATEVRLRARLADAERTIKQLRADLERARDDRVTAAELHAAMRRQRRQGAA